MPDTPTGIRLQFLGDISLNGLFCDPQYYVPLGENLTEVTAMLGPCDLRVGNFESPLWGGQGFNYKKEPRMATTAEAATSILSLDLDVAILANNHFYDCLDRGSAATREFFAHHGVATVGTGPSQAQAIEPRVVELNGKRVGIVAFLDPLTNPNAGDARTEFVSYLGESRICEQIAELRSQVDLVIVSLHWGKYELLRYPSLRQKKLGRRIVDCGADIVVGHHSHCVQGYETWNDGLIFYSMGNFVFGGGRGKEHVPWPRHARNISVADVLWTGSGLPEVRMHHFVQSEHLLAQDNAAARGRAQERLNQSLAIGDKAYLRLFRRELFWQWVVLAPFRFIRSSGGIYGAVRRMRWTHLVALKRMLLR